MQGNNKNIRRYDILKLHLAWDIHEIGRIYQNCCLNDQRIMIPTFFHFSGRHWRLWWSASWKTQSKWMNFQTQKTEKTMNI